MPEAGDFGYRLVLWEGSRPKNVMQVDDVAIAATPQEGFDRLCARNGFTGAVHGFGTVEEFAAPGRAWVAAVRRGGLHLRGRA